MNQPGEAGQPEKDSVAMQVLQPAFGLAVD